MLQVTNKGLVIDQITDIQQRLIDGFRNIYGEDINVDADTPDGQMLGLLSQLLSDINEVIAFMFQMLDPYRATGEWLEQRALYAGIVRRGAEYSYINDVVITGSHGTTIPQGSIFSDGNSNKWVSLQAVTLNNFGSAKLSLRSQELGVFSLPANQELTMETVVIGVDRIVLTRESTPGNEEETDGQLLVRFMQSHSINNNDDREGIKSALSSLPDVRKVEVIENYTNNTDVVTGVTAHTMNAIVFGGNDLDIATTLLKKKIGGCAFMGDQQVVVNYKGMDRTVLFDRAEEVAISVKLVIRRLVGFTDIDTDGIKASLENTDFEIGESVYAMRLTCPVNSISGFVIISMTVNQGDSVDIGVRQYAKIHANDVEVIVE